MYAILDENTSVAYAMYGKRGASHMHACVQSDAYVHWRFVHTDLLFTNAIFVHTKLSVYHQFNVASTNQTCKSLFGYDSHTCTKSNRVSCL